MKIYLKSVIAAAAAVFAVSTAGVYAADLPMRPVNTVKPKFEEEVGPWQIRVRALTVLPQDGGSVHAAGLGKLTSSGLGFSASETPELDISYFFTKNIAAELVLGTTNTKISGRGKTMKSLNMKGNLGKTWILPPTLTLQYHFTNFGKFQPYIGGGVNYTFFYNEKHYKLDDLTVDGTWGGAAQAGFDYMFTKHWGFNFDAKKLWLNTSYHGKLGPKSNLGVDARNTRISGRAKLDPWLLGAGVTYRF